MVEEGVVFTPKSVWRTVQVRRCATRSTSASRYRPARRTTSATRGKSVCSLSLAKRLVSPHSSIPQSNAGATLIVKPWEGLNPCARRRRMARGSASNLVSPAFLLAKRMSSATRSTGDFPRKRLTNGECECVLGGWGANIGYICMSMVLSLKS